MRRTPYFVCIVLLASAGVSASQEPKPRAPLKILDGQPTRLFFTGNPHHPTFGQEKLTALLHRYFDGKSPIVVDGLADARKDPDSNLGIPPVKAVELGKFIKAPLEAAKTKKERFIALTYVIVEQPRTKPSEDWVKEGADALEKYGRETLKRGAAVVFFSEMVQPNHIKAGNAGNKFRRAGLQVFEALTARKIPGLERGPHFQELMEKHEYFFRDDRHFSTAGKDYMGCLWFERLLRHDGREEPGWFTREKAALSK